MIEKVDLEKKNINDYYQFLEEDKRKELETHFSNLKNKKILYLSSTSEGGGVAQLLKSLVPLFNSGGLSCSWYVMDAPKDFFNITKKIHNYFQGGVVALTNTEKEKYLKINKKVADKLKKLNFDLLVVHDPQPMAVNRYLSFSPSILRMHLDSSSYSISKDNFFPELVNFYDHFLFSLKDHVFTSENYSIASPAIDPLSNTNKPLNNPQEIVKSLGMSLDKPLIAQVSRFDKFKNPTGVVEAYKKLKGDFPDLQLVLFGINNAEDDPEAEKIFEKVKKIATGEENIKLFFNSSSISELDYNEKEIVNAIQRESDVIIQNSYREAFGLTITEAMWKQAPVVGGPAIGVKKQITNGKNGFIAGNQKEVIKKTKRLLQNSKLSAKIGKKAKKSVQRNYLITKLISKHLDLYSNLLN